MAGIGTMGGKYLDGLMENYGYSAVVIQLAECSMKEAEGDEIYSEAAAGYCLNGISILTDAHYCWRKNARFSDIVCMGQHYHKVIQLETISEADDQCTQCHEMLGV